MMKYKAGDRVRTSFPARTVIVTGRDPDIKNDKPGFEGVIPGGPKKGMPTWGYDEDIIRVQPGSSSQVSLAHSLQNEYSRRDNKRRSRSNTIRKAKDVATDPLLWLAGAGIALVLFRYWRQKSTPSTPVISGVPPYAGPRSIG